MEDSTLPAVPDEWEKSEVWKGLKAVKNGHVYKIKVQTIYGVKKNRTTPFFGGDAVFVTLLFRSYFAGWCIFWSERIILVSD
ncbi:hypothetical protein [Paenibacillus tundrae]|uniref:Uncharacterized protein n=1 Tax=Paenibacillus tundrae TaxID=528187 RepID=A0ABT9WMP1_9BACL|nr:hypothetical protein [Paenibacillus tundrae]MDQ0174045.1 hypothetical protein [Paenibacillus tundrae]